MVRRLVEVRMRAPSIHGGLWTHYSPSVTTSLSLMLSATPQCIYGRTEVCVLALLVLSGLYDCVFFSRAALSQPRVQLTPAQRKLLRVAEEKGSGKEGLWAIAFLCRI